MSNDMIFVTSSYDNILVTPKDENHPQYGKYIETFYPVDYHPTVLGNNLGSEVISNSELENSEWIDASNEDSVWINQLKHNGEGLIDMLSFGPIMIGTNDDGSEYRYCITPPLNCSQVGWFLGTHTTSKNVWEGFKVVVDAIMKIAEHKAKWNPYLPKLDLPTKKETRPYWFDSWEKESVDNFEVKKLQFVIRY